MMRKTVLLSFLLLVLCQLGVAQTNVVKVFKTFEAYENGEGIEIGEYWNFSWSLRELILVIKNNGKETKRKMSGDWGFLVDTVLYRIDNNTPYRVEVVSEDGVYYRHGVGKDLNSIGECAKPRMQHTNYQFSLHHVSENLTSPVFVITSGKAKKAFAENEKLLAILKCAKGNWHPENCFE